MNNASEEYVPVYRMVLLSLKTNKRSETGGFYRRCHLPQDLTLSTQLNLSYIRCHDKPPTRSPSQLEGNKGRRATRLVLAVQSRHIAARGRFRLLPGA